ncbi:MAG: hypothetical protein GY842_26665 [bacterium]|nr:hypothetical protein [bacterium]
MSQKDQNHTLLWEALCAPQESPAPTDTSTPPEPRRVPHMPFSLRCTALTKAGRRCRGRARKGTGFCPFHDPELSAERRQQIAASGGRRHHRLARLPDGYLRKLTSRRAVGDAMDRLYREIRLSKITPEMGAVLFGILTRVLDSGLADNGAIRPAGARRSKADKLRPKLRELLTRAERSAWNRAVAEAPEHMTGESAAPRRKRPARTTEDQAAVPGLAGLPGRTAVPATS